MNLDDNSQEIDICRVCRSEAFPDKPLFHPCICMGSIKYIHQDCLIQWLKFSKKEYCELCNFKFSFTPIYSADMPKRLPIKDLVYGLLSNILTAVKYWVHYSIVAIGWLIIVPSLSYRLIRCLFDGSFYSFFNFTLSVDKFAFDKLIAEEFYGFISVVITILTVISIIWLRELIIREIPDWLGNENNEQDANQQPNDQLPIQDNQANNDQLNDNNDNVNNNLDDLINPDEIVNPVEVDDAIDRQENNELIAVQEDGNWINPNEEISFERIFGLDGSLIFLEHIFWIISLNAIFVFVFAFLPYHIGLFSLSKLKLYSFDINDDDSNKFEKILITFVGYIIIGSVLVTLHYLLLFKTKFARARRLLGICFLIVKVGVVTVLEIILLPMICGFLLDIFSLPLFGSTIYDREAYFKSSPGLSTFIHWAIGFFYIFSISSFCLLLKDILKPRLIHFFETLNNPDFSPVQEIIHLSVFQLLRRYIFYLIVFVLLTFLIIFLPVKATEKMFDDFLPFNITSTGYENKTQENTDHVSEMWQIHLGILSLFLYDYTSLRSCIKSVLYYICLFFAYLLDLKSYLMRQDDDNEDENDDEDIEEDDFNDEIGDENDELSDENKNLLESSDENNTNSNQQKKPTYLYFRLFGLFNLVCLAIFLFGFLMITLPKFIGCRTLGFFFGEQIGELCTIPCGLYVIVLGIEIIHLMIQWLPRGWNEISNKFKKSIFRFAKTMTAAVLLCGFLPLIIGFLFEVMIFVPIRVSYNQTPIYYLLQDWLLGILLIKVIILMAVFNEWNLRGALQEFYHDGFGNIDIKKIITKFISPVFFTVGLVLSIPYVFVYALLPYFGLSNENLNLVLRKIYLSISCLFILACVIQWQINKFCKLYEHIKNEKYLVGRKLINFDGYKRQSEQQRRSTLD